MLSIEDLNKPRYKVIADFWDSPFLVGDIIQMVLKKKKYFPFNEDGSQDENEYWVSELITQPKGGKTSYLETAFTSYPHLFRKMDWNEERKFEDMPEYINVKGCGIFKVQDWYDERHKAVFTYPNSEFFSVIDNHILPATLEEYTSFVNQTTKP